MLSKNQIKDLQALQLKKNRDQKSLFIAEGIKTVTEIINKRPDKVRLMFGTNEFYKKLKPLLERHNLLFTEVTEEELKKISLQSSPNHVLAVCKYFDEKLSLPDFTKEVGFYLDDIRDPGNFGTILRLAAWFGHKVLVCSKASCDLYNPKVIQATMGAFLSVNVIYAELSDLNLSKETKVYGAVLNGKNVYQEPLKNGLIVIGNEANGINETNLKLVTDLISIPTGNTGGAESLNAAMAASIIASEFFRRQT